MHIWHHFCIKLLYITKAINILAYLDSYF